MSEIIWILTAIAGLVLVLLAVAVIIWKKKGGKHESDYRRFFWIGLIWMIIGAGFMFIYDNLTFNGLFAMGVIFFIMGAANRNKWKKKRPPTPGQK